MIIRILLALGLVAPATIAVSADLATGQKLSRQCAVCHGRDGIATDPEVPNLAGQSALYLEKSMQDYKTGIREDRRMTLIAENLSDEDIKALAAWYEAHEVTVTLPSP